MPAISLLGTDYATISAWWTAEKDNDYTGAGPILEIPAGVVDTFAATFQFRYGTASKYTIRAAAGSEVNGNCSNEAVIAVINVAGNDWDFRNNNIEFQDVYIKGVDFTSSGDSYNNLTFRRCVVFGHLEMVGVAPDVYGPGSVFIQNQATSGVLNSTAIYPRGAIAFNGVNTTIVDFTATNGGGAFRNRSTAVQTLVNAVVIGVNTTAYVTLDTPPAPTVTNCAASDATLPGAVITNLTTAIFENFAAGDYRIKNDSAPALLATPAGAFIAPSDTAAPVLSAPTATTTGSTTASGSVTTDEANGTLYFYASANAAETAATIKTSDSSQAVSATGAQAVSFTGLTPSTVYYAHYVHVDAATAANESNVVSSAQFTTAAPSLTIGTISDTTPESNTQITVNHTNAQGLLTTPNFNIASQTGTQFVLDIPDITTLVLAGQTTPTLNFNTAVVIPISDGVNSDNVDLLGIQNPAGTFFGDITSIDPNGVYANDTGVVVGMFGYFFNVTGNLTIFPESGIVLDDGAGGSYSYKLYNGEWGTAVTNTIEARPQGTVTIDSIVPSKTSAVIAFSYAGSDLTGFQYRLDGGAWVAATSPLTISGLTAATQYTFEVTAVNNGRIGDISTTTFTSLTMTAISMGNQIILHDVLKNVLSDVLHDIFEG